MQSCTEHEHRPTDLHLRMTLGNPGMLATFSSTDAAAQAQLQQKLKVFVGEQLDRLQAPRLKQASWESAGVEVVAESTLRYIAALEGLLEEITADPDTAEALAARIDATLQ